MRAQVSSEVRAAAEDHQTLEKQHEAAGHVLHPAREKDRGEED